MDGILRRYGHDVYLQRRLPDSSTSSRVRYSTKFERHTTRNMHPSSVGLASEAEEEVEGLVHNADRVFWFRWTTDPREGDRIWEEDPRVRFKGQPSIYKIDMAHAMRGVEGRIEFWVCGCTRDQGN
jgi:hypothetical protein